MALTRITDKQVTYKQGSSGSVVRNLGEKLREVVSVKDFGAVGDGVTDDTAAFELMVTYCAASGVDGYIPAGTYLIDPSIRTFSGSKPFVIRGAGRGATTLKNRNSTYSFIYWTGANGAVFKDLKIDGSFTGLPSVPSSGGTLVFQNSSDNACRNIDIVNIWRIAVMIFNDHQTNTMNSYGGHTIEHVRVFGPSNYIDNVGPSAFILADVNNSSITNCYINQIGLYGYEFKNDCSNTIIANCVAEDVYFPLYYGGDGAHTELGYVKQSIIESCITNRATSGTAITLGRALNNAIRNVSIDQTGVATPNSSIYITTKSCNNSISDISLKGRNYEAISIRNGSNSNYVEFSNIIDGVYSGRGSTGIGNDCSNNTLIFGNRDSTQQMVLSTYSFNANTVIDKKFNLENLDPTTSALKRVRFGDVGIDNLPSGAKGLAVIGNTADYFQTTAQESTYQYYGSFDKYNIASIRYRLTDGVKFEYLYNGTSTATFVTDPTNGYYPQADNVQKLGLATNRWSTIYAGTGTINTSDAREKQQIASLSAQERAVATRLKSLIRTFKFNDAVEAKGDGARIHVGVIAQEVMGAFEAEGLDPMQYAIVCYDEWEAVAEELDEGGNVLSPAVAAGNRYGVRYEELLAFMIAAL